MVYRVASFSSTASILSGNMRIQAKLADTQTQMSTGLKSISYKGISRETQKLLSFESAQSDLKGYNVNGTVVNSYVNIMYGSMEQMVSLANSMLTTLTAAQSSNNDPAVTQSQAQLLMKEFSGLLNTSSGGRYLFGGTAIDNAPVDLTDPAWTPQTTPSTVNSSYYQGNNQTVGFQASTNITVNYGVEANNSAFEKALRAFNLASNNSSNKTALAEASTLMQQSISEMANIMGRLSTNSRTIEDAMQNNEEDISVLDEISKSIKGVDLPSASVRQAELEAQLQSAYASSVKVLRLSILNYL